jgi:hypothetical protein
VKRFWGIDEQGNRVLVIDDNFIDHPYGLIDNGYGASKVAGQINEMKESPIVKLDV